MNKFLGEYVQNKKDTPYSEYTQKDWALFWIFMYGGIDGAHHKDWVIDQVVRILKGTKVKIRLAKWSDGNSEYRFNLYEPTQEYWDWVKESKNGEDGPETYDYNFGIAP